MRHFVSASMLALLAAAMAIPPGHTARAGVLIDITGDQVSQGGASGDSGVTEGYAFTVVNPITIDGLGFFDVGGADLGVASVPVGLWTSAGALLAQVAVTNGSMAVPSTDANGDWLVETITPLTLPAGDYLLGAVLGVFAPSVEAGGDVTFSTSPDIVGISGRYDVSGGLQAPMNATIPNDPDPPIVFPAVFGPTLYQAVPEPGTLAVFAMGIGGLAGARRRVRRDVAKAA